MSEDQIADLIKKKEEEEESHFSSQDYTPPELRKYESDIESPQEYQKQNCKNANLTTKEEESSLDHSSFQHNGQYENDELQIEETEDQNQQEYQHYNQARVIRLQNFGEIPQKRVKLTSSEEELFQGKEQKQFKFGEFQDIKKEPLKQEEYDQNQQQVLRNNYSKNNYKYQNPRCKNSKGLFQSTKQIQNVGLVVQKSLFQEDIQNPSFLKPQLKKADQCNEVSSVIEAETQKKIKEQTIQISATLQKVQEYKIREQPSRKSEKIYENLQRFIQKTSKWKCFSKYSPNILVHLICDFAGSQKFKQVIFIYDTLAAQLRKMDEDWEISFNLHQPIKLKKNLIDSRQIDTTWTFKKKSKNMGEVEAQKSSDFYFLQNFKKLCKGIGIVFGKTEFFTDVYNKLEIQIQIQPNQIEQIQSLKYVVQKIQQHKEKKLMKKILDFDQANILDLYKVPEIKEQVDNIYKKIESSPQNFLEYINVNSITSYDTKKSDKNLDNQDKKSKPKKTNLDHLKSLIQKVQHPESVTSQRQI